MRNETEMMLQEVNNAIKKVLNGGQSYKIGTRQLTRADLAELRKMKENLEEELKQGQNGLLDNTSVAVFEGR